MTREFRVFPYLRISTALDFRSDPKEWAKVCEQATRRKRDKVSFIPELRDLGLTRLAHPDSFSNHSFLSACRCVRIVRFLSGMVSQNRQLHMDPMTTDKRRGASGESVKS